jgi:hypothetical protein
MLFFQILGKSINALLIIDVQLVEMRFNVEFLQLLDCVLTQLLVSSYIKFERFLVIFFLRGSIVNFLTGQVNLSVEFRNKTLDDRKANA